MSGTRLRRNTEYDRLTVAVMKRTLRPDSNGIDVGAHRGTLLRHLVDIAPDGHHVALEPLPAYAAALRRRFPTVQVCQCAASDEDGEATFFHVVTNPSYSGLTQRQYPHDGEAVETVSVRVARLDDVVDPDTPIRFVKVDVEGSELAVLRGARTLLERWHPAVVFEHGWDDGAPPADDTSGALFDLLAGCGLGTYELVTWLVGGSPLTKQQFGTSLAQGSYYFIAAEGSGTRG